MIATADAGSGGGDARDCVARGARDARDCVARGARDARDCVARAAGLEVAAVPSLAR